jgi:hypothetical protein
VPALSPDRQDSYLREILRGRGDGDRPEVEELDEAEDRLAQSASQDDVVEALRGTSGRAREVLVGAAVERLAEEDIERNTEHVLQKFSRLLEPNPRAMKIFVNGYGVELASRLLEGDLPDRDPLALWFILRSRWPGLADALRARPELVECVGPDKTVPDGVSEENAELLRSPGVEHVVCFPDGGPLTKELVEELNGYRARTASPAANGS